MELSQLLEKFDLSSVDERQLAFIREHLSNISENVDETKAISSLKAICKLWVVKQAPLEDSHQMVAAGELMGKVILQFWTSNLKDKVSIQRAALETFLQGVKAPMTLYTLTLLEQLAYTGCLTQDSNVWTKEAFQQLVNGLKPVFPLASTDSDTTMQFGVKFNEIFYNCLFYYLSTDVIMKARSSMQELYFLCMQCVMNEDGSRCLGAIRGHLENLFYALPEGQTDIFAVVDNVQEFERHLLLLRDLVSSPEFLEPEQSATPIDYYGIYISNAFRDNENVRKSCQKLVITVTFDLWLLNQRKIKEFCCKFVSYWAIYQSKLYFKDDEAFIEEHTRLLVRMVEESTDEEIKELYVTKPIFQIVDDIFKPVWRPQNGPTVVDLFLATFLKFDEFMAHHAETLLTQPRILKWKDMPKKTVQLFSMFVSIDPEQFPDGTNVSSTAASAFSEWMNGIRSSRVLMKLLIDPIQSLLLRTVTDANPNAYWSSLAKSCVSEIDMKTMMPVARPYLIAVEKLIRSGNFEETLETRGPVTDFISTILEHLKEQGKFGDLGVELGAIIDALLTQELEDNGKSNCYGSLLNEILYSMAYTREEDVMKVCLPAMLKCLNVDSKSMRILASSAISAGMEAFKDLLVPHFSLLLSSYCEYSYEGWGYTLAALYSKDPSALHQQLDVFFDHLKGSEKKRADALTVLVEVAKLHPELIGDDKLNQIMKLLDNPVDQFMAALVCFTVAEKQPQRFIANVERFIALLDTAPMSRYSCCSALGWIGFAAKAPKGQQIVKALVARVNDADQTYRYQLLQSIFTVGSKHRPLLKENQKLFEKHLDDPQTQELCTRALDVIAGRTNAELDARGQLQQKQLNGLDQQATLTKQRVSSLDQQSEQLTANVTRLQDDVSTVKSDLSQLAERVAQMEFRLEDVDQQMVSMAPKWVTPLAQLLSKRDWRLLAQRLGYSPADVEVLNGDTRALLAHWMCCQPPGSAAEALRAQLDELAWTAERDTVIQPSIIADPEPRHSKPTVFLSYQWAHQAQVKLLWRHLLSAGYHCWMDIGQMGGGDKLFARLDDGIRSAKVVVSCVTPLYARSANCTREVNLSVSLNKPILPLLIEQMEWPPAGAMGPIFSEYLFIRFFQRDSERTGDDRYWPAAKFDELLMQIRYHAPPDRDVSKAALWEWSPSEQATSAPVASPQAEASSSKLKVFLSYQWAHQRQVKALRACLVGLGVYCWMDVFEMGGGDSLYEKIDNGIRDTGVIISCVSEKYIVSMNCRREVSLADGLKKPIVPLIVDEKLQWPPSGPMGPVLTSLTPIRVPSNVQEAWPLESPEVRELLRRVKEHLLESRDRVENAVDYTAALDMVSSKACILS